MFRPVRLRRAESQSPSPDKRITVVRQAFSEGAIARVQVLQYGDDPEVEPGQAAARVFFDWPGRAASPRSLSYRITDRGGSAPARDEAQEDRTPVMVRLGPSIWRPWTP